MKIPSNLHVGEVRPSQMMYTYGVGSIVDLPNLSVIVMGLDDWPKQLTTITEPRLLAAVRHRLRHVEKLCDLPRAESDSVAGPKFGEDNTPGVPVAIFPRWWVCPVCRLLAPLSAGLFDMGKVTYPPDKISLKHTGCTKAKVAPQVIPARILVACENGHLDDFPWQHFVHRGESCKMVASSLTLDEVGVSGEVRDLEVRCSCGERRRLVDAFGEDNRKKMPMCTGRWPHLRSRDDHKCERKMRSIALGASNLWFPSSISVLSIPSSTDNLMKLVHDRWDVLDAVEKAQDLPLLRKINQIYGELASYEDAAIFKAIRDYRARQKHSLTEAPPDIKLPEYQMLQEADPNRNSRDFQTRRLALSQAWGKFGITDVVLVERLRAVQALIGFARLDSAGELTDIDQRITVGAAPISRRQLDWVPASEVRGEGVFFRFDEAKIVAWEQKKDVEKYERIFHKAYTEWRKNRRIRNPEANFPGIRYVLLHSFAHAFMRQLTLEAGYTASSLMERIYARGRGVVGGPMSGVLIYTAASDSEGTLGGLIGLGENETNLYDLTYQALENIALCAGDPLCGEHTPDPNGRTVHGSACHACLFAPETSCECGNRFLDRASLVETVFAPFEDTGERRPPIAFIRGLLE